jgi:ABC-2 type transport system permease protein
MFTLFIKTITKSKTTLLAYLVIIVGLVWMYIAFYPSIASESTRMKELVAGYPEGFLDVFNIDIETLFDSFEGFMAGENYSLLWPLITTIFAIALGSGSIAAEIDRGTIELLLSQPISRAQIYWAKYLANVFILFIFVITSTLSVIPLAWLHKISINYLGHFWIAGLGMLFAVTILSIATMFSTMANTRGKPVALGAGIIIVMYALNVLASLEDSLDPAKYASFFYYFNYNAAIIKHQIDPLNMGVFLGTTLVCVIIGLIVFRKRDIAV